ncbi:ABC transporter substrate-binding protein [Streptomyces sp. NPDC006529]|uniref:ABC transporter substrate-binding protein n=1 Tax=Streptomyces sp. NPDC006529 TaxID=3157177 RepID=UPI0033AF525A
MTDWRTASRSRSRTLLTRAVTTVTSTVAGACLLTGCGLVPGATGGSGGTITVMTWAPEGTKATNMGGMPAMAKAYERWINGKGGINGRKLHVLTCNEHNTAGGAADCARQAIAARAVAVVGSYSQWGRAFMAPLEAEGIPFIGGYGVSAEEFQSTLSYPVNGGQPVLLAGAGHQLGKACDDVALVRPDTLAGDSMPILLNAGFKAVKPQREAADVRAPEDSANYVDEARAALTEAAKSKGKEKDKDREKTAAAASDKDGGCVAAVLGERTETFFDSFRRLDTQAKKPQLSSVLGSVSQSLVDRTGGKESQFEGAYVTSWYPVSGDPLWQPMRKVIAENAFGDNRVNPDDTGTQTTWIAYSVFSEIVKRLGKDGEVTGRTVSRALNHSPGVETGGLTPGLSWRYQDMRAVGGFPRMANCRVTFQVVQDGRIVAQPGETTMDMTQTLEAAPRSG